MYFPWNTHLPPLFKPQAPVAQKVDNTIHWINLCRTDSAINVNNNYMLWITIYVFHNLQSHPVMLIFAPHRFKGCNLHDQKHFSLDNGVMTTPKRRILSFVYTVLCLKKSLLIRLTIYPVENNWDQVSQGYTGLFSPESARIWGAGAQLRIFFGQKLENNDILSSGFITY